jgi:hypothetical protein
VTEEEYREIMALREAIRVAMMGRRRRRREPNDKPEAKKEGGIEAREPGRD